MTKFINLYFKKNKFRLQPNKDISEKRGIMAPKMILNNAEMFEDTTGVSRNRKSKNGKHNGQKKKDRRTNNELQNTTQTTNDLKFIK